MFPGFADFRPDGHFLLFRQPFAEEVGAVAEQSAVVGEVLHLETVGARYNFVGTEHVRGEGAAAGFAAEGHVVDFQGLEYIVEVYLTEVHGYTVIGILGCPAVDVHELVAASHAYAVNVYDAVGVVDGSLCHVPYRIGHLELRRHHAESELSGVGDRVAREVDRHSHFPAVGCGTVEVPHNVGFQVVVYA